MEATASAAESTNLHIVMLPWLAMGHLLPFFELSKRLALKGLRISFISTPSNLLRLPPIPQPLSPLLSLIPFPFPFPSNLDNTTDLPSESARPLLTQSYSSSFQTHLSSFLSDSSIPKPNWIIYDFAAGTWAPSLASRFGINSAFFSLFNAAALSFLIRAIGCSSPEDITNIPNSIPFPTKVAFRSFEARRIHSSLPEKAEKEEHKAWRSELMLIRTCNEFDAKWLDLLGGNMYTPVGFLPPCLVEEEEESEAWRGISKWLDEREDFSVIYAAFGSEVVLTGEQIDEIGLGLERSGMEFVWVLRVGFPPEGFRERMEGRGLVWMGWVPQARVLAHRAVGGFLTHGGWNSVVEGMAVGKGMVILPMMFEQGLNARHVEESGYGVEVGRGDEDGCFCGEEIGRKLRMVMVEEEGEEVRRKARMGKEVFGSEKLQEEYVEELVKNLWEKREAVAAEPL